MIEKSIQLRQPLAGCLLFSSALSFVSSLQCIPCMFSIKMPWAQFQFFSDKINNFMHKKESIQLITKPSSARFKTPLRKSLLTACAYSSINPIQEAQAVDEMIEKRSQWKFQQRKSKLQETYKQNCRLFISIQNQKSSYALPKLKNTPTFNVTNRRRSQLRKNKTAIEHNNRYHISKKTSTSHSKKGIDFTNVHINKINYDDNRVHTCQQVQIEGNGQTADLKQQLKTKILKANFGTLSIGTSKYRMNAREVLKDRNLNNYTVLQKSHKKRPAFFAVSTPDKCDLQT